ncbi:MAG: hypothetical protein ABI041_19500 [Bdellovibrionia bacterium]
MPTSEFNREKYLQIAKSQGIGAALTQLQTDTVGWEYEAFEGEKGYQPKEWQALLAVRDFARELWELDLRS